VRKTLFSIVVYLRFGGDKKLLNRRFTLWWFNANRAASPLQMIADVRNFVNTILLLT